MVYNPIRILKALLLVMGCLKQKGNPFIFYIFFYLSLIIFPKNDLAFSQVLYSIFRFDTIITNPSHLLILSDESIIILSSDNNLMIKLDKNGGHNKSIGSKGWGNLNFDNPTSIFSPDDLNIYIADCYNSRIQRFNRNLEFVASLNYNETNIKYPYLVGVDKFSNLFIFDLETRRIFKFDKNKKFERTFGEIELSSTQPFKLDFDSNNNIIIADKNKILVFSNWGFLIKEFKFISEIKCFSIYQNKIFTLAKDTLFEYEIEGKLIDRHPLQSIIKNIQQYEFKDLAFKKDFLYLLTQKDLIKININALINWKKK